MSLAGRCCVITGAGRGIGRAIALRLTAAGASAMVAARTARDLEETVIACAAHDGPCIAQVTDVTRPEAVEQLVRRCEAEFGRLDVLINNAGTAPLAPIDEMTLEVFDRLVATNVHSIFYACRAAWPLLKATHGTIINISSLAALDPFPGFAAYGATKAWVNTFTHSLANEGKPFGITAFALAPGAVETQALRGLFPDLPTEEALQPDDVAGVVELLLDERWRHATGQTIYVRR